MLVDGSHPRRGRCGARPMSPAAMHASLVARSSRPRTRRGRRRPGADLQEAIDDAVDLGAQVIRLEAADVAAGVVQRPAIRGATHVVLPYDERTALERLRRPTLAERVLQALPDIEVHVVAAPPASD